MTESEVISEIRQRVLSAGSMRALAEEWGITVSYVSDLLNGRRAPGVKILQQLGLEKVKTVEYRPIVGRKGKVV